MGLEHWSEIIEIIRTIANLSNSFGINSGTGYFATGTGEPPSSRFTD
jgi:hypothetical protein